MGFEHFGGKFGDFGFVVTLFFDGYRNGWIGGGGGGGRMVVIGVVVAGVVVVVAVCCGGRRWTVRHFDTSWIGGDLGDCDRHGQHGGSIGVIAGLGGCVYEC